MAQDRKEAGLATGLDVTCAQIQVENEKQRSLFAHNAAERTRLILIHALEINFSVRLELTKELMLVQDQEPSSRQALTTA